MGYIMRYCGVSNDFLHGKRGQTRLPPCFCSASTLRIHTLPPRSTPHTEETTGLGKEENTPEKEAPTVVCKPLYHD